MTLFLDSDMSALDEMDRDFTQFNALHAQLGQLTDAQSAVASMGTNQATLSALRASRLLTGASLSSIALESTGHLTRDDRLQQVAMESITGQITETSAAWAAKILHIAKVFGDRIVKVLAPIYETTSNLIKAGANKVWDGAKAAGRAVKAHPFATVMAVVGSIAAVAAVLAYCGSNLPGGRITKETLTPFFDRVNGLMDKVDGLWPFKKVKTEVVKLYTVTERIYETPKGVGIVQSMKTSRTIVELGYTQSAMHVLGGHLDKAWGATKLGILTLGVSAKKTMHSFSNLGNKAFWALPNYVYNKTGSRTATEVAETISIYTFALILIGLFAALKHLITQVVIGGMKFIGKTLYRVFG